MFFLTHAFVYDREDQALVAILPRTPNRKISRFENSTDSNASTLPFIWWLWYKMSLTLKLIQKMNNKTIFFAHASSGPSNTLWFWRTPRQRKTNMIVINNVFGFYFIYEFRLRIYTGNCFQDYVIMTIKKVKNNSFIKYRFQWKYLQFLKLHNSILNNLDRTKIVSSVLLEQNRTHCVIFLVV